MILYILHICHITSLCADISEIFHCTKINVLSFYDYVHIYAINKDISTFCSIHVTIMISMTSAWTSVIYTAVLVFIFSRTRELRPS